MIGRAGRVGLESLGLLQTYQLGHPVIKALLSCQPEEFYTREILSTPILSFVSLWTTCLFDCIGTTAPSRRTLCASTPSSCALGEKNISVTGPAEAPFLLVQHIDLLRFSLFFMLQVGSLCCVKLCKKGMPLMKNFRRKGLPQH